MKFFYKSSCTTCRNAKKYLKDRGATVTERDMTKSPLRLEEIDALIGKRDYIPFLNTRNALYREKNFKENPPTRKQALEWMAKEPNLIKRPLLVDGARIVFGFDAKAYKSILS
ncbi:MAG: ArsC/Spx/MgsR family protein [Bdellovibrionota bacterium]